MKDDTPWLDDDEMRLWRSFLAASASVQSRLNELLKDASGLTMDDYEVLVHLSEADDNRIRMTELSNRLLHSQSRLTQRVDRLVKKELVCREKCPEDRRGTFACLTDHGRRTMEAIAPDHVRDVRRLLVDVIDGKDRVVVSAALERIAARAADEAT